MSKKPNHFYVVFNPLLGYQNNDFPTQAHEFYSRLKNLWETDTVNPHMYWGKIKKTKNNPDLAIEKFEKVILENQSLQLNTHLYISDFTNVWVAKVESVCRKISDFSLTLDIYKNEEVEMWFKISEMDLIFSKSADTIDFLSCLSTENVKSLNPYLGGLRYPLIVQDNYEEDYFAKVDSIKSRMLIENLQITNSSDRIRTLVEGYVIPHRNFSQLPTAIRNEILASELSFLEIEKSNGLKTKMINKVAISYIQILEGVLNATFVKEFKTEANLNLIKNYAKANPQESVSNCYYTDRHLSLNEVWKCLNRDSFGGCIGVKKHLKSVGKSELLNFCLNDVYKILDSSFVKEYGLADIRNDQTHLQGKIELSFEDALEIRNLILGVGCKGLINSLVEISNSHKGSLKAAA